MILESVGIAIVLLVLIIWIALEVPFRRRPGNAMEVLPGNWDLDATDPQHYRLVGNPSFSNPASSLEVMLPELKADVAFLSKGSLEQIKHTLRITTQHPDAEAREDGYWFAYILKSHHQTTVTIHIDIEGPNLSELKAAWVRLHYISYGPKGRIPNVHHEVVPLKFPDPQAPMNWRSAPNSQVLPIPTHLLTPLDNCVDIVRRYVAPHAQPGDIVTIGETPVAIMQSRWRHPGTIKPGWVARRVCYFFHPTSSLATACGLQALVDIVGPLRVLFAFLGGVIGKVLGQPGMFYRLAGEQARLIDDVTGTLPPYDQFIILGPEDPQQVVNQIQAETGLAAAIVDVNDLQRVKVLAATTDASIPTLESALRSNPAGNANEQTPVVLIRPQHKGIDWFDWSVINIEQQFRYHGVRCVGEIAALSLSQLH